MEPSELSKLIKYERQFNWSITKYDVEVLLGRVITNEEFNEFGKLFSEHFKYQYDDTLKWLAENYDEVKEWDE